MVAFGIQSKTSHNYCLPSWCLLAFFPLDFLSSIQSHVLKQCILFLSSISGDHIMNSAYSGTIDEQYMTLQLNSKAFLR